jgi:methyltransferase
VSLVAVVTGVVFGLMLAEQRVSQRHEGWLREAGAIEAPGDVYRIMAVLYPLAFASMAAEGFWHAASLSAVGVERQGWAASGVLLFCASKGLKYWAIQSLGTRWSFRVLVQPGRPLVTSGPYRYIAHPNYVAVVGELVAAAMMVGARITGPLMVVLFSLALWARIRVEDRALGRRAAGRSEGASNLEGKSGS